MTRDGRESDRTPPPPRLTKASRWWRSDRGSAAVEVTLLTPVLIMLLVFVAVVIHRGVTARLRLDDAAHQAARAASIERSAADARTAARTAVTGALGSGDVVCRSPRVDVDTTGLTAGGAVTATVTCTLDLGDALVGVPTRTLSASATEVVDTWRAADTTDTTGDSR
ncbi:Flp pilus assembly protein TadG [Actinoalloteichus hoggarensis]|uniref:TadE-like protein n=1 Tax=Actinoalloteichus hoggarensis TaxID=1470176 RepID=A0A221W7D9_9PSEU|nr:TadE/TadG family type IV pilus assembly protein [Actinoalloteichus hoggarensis]ASO21603.1 TadE-like protein [Actinoalloteichus hoggarensis]MBB5922195.1 Flp pilus assembly protein TadG [Actinoalloteichus hoggarensis]